MIIFWRIFLTTLLAGYILSCASAFLPTSIFLFSNIFSIAFPYLFALSLLAALIHLLFFRRKWYLLLIVILLGSYNLSNLFGTGSKNFSLQKNKNDLRILTWNVESFSPPEAFANTLDTYDPDVVCFQEYIPVQTSITVLKEKGYTYNALSIDSVISESTNSSMGFGVAVFSKHPLNNIKRTPYTADNHIRQMLSAHLSFYDKIVQVHTFHLLSYQISKRKEEFADENNLKYTIKRLVRVSENQEKQIITYNKAIAGNSIPDIVCGDFNSVPTSYVLTKQKQINKTPILKAPGDLVLLFLTFCAR